MGATESANTNQLYIDAQREELISSLCDVYDTQHGLAVVTAPKKSGLTTLMKAFAQRLRTQNASKGEIAVAILDVSQTTVAGLLVDLLSAFGYELPQATQTELLSMTQLIAQHQAQAGLSPLVILEHVDKASLQTLAVINQLAALRHARKSACSIVLTGDDALNHIVNAEGMSEVGKRISLQMSLSPYTQDERREFIRVILANAGVGLQEPSINNLARLGDGWPGSMIDEMRAAIQQRRSAKTLGSTDTLATLEQELAHRAKTVVDPTGIDDTTILRASDAIAAPQSEECEIIDTPGSGSSLGEFLVNHNGKLIERFPVTRRKVLVGRAQHNDIVLDSKWVSRYHAIIVCHRTGASLVDINSTNGMTVNSTLVRQGDLMHNDIIVIGDYRIKYLNPAAERREATDELSDTRVLKKLDTADFDVTTPVGTSRKDQNG
ncbi:MAG: FHA domain-containing protein [Pseudomonadota bacterium]